MELNSYEKWVSLDKALERVRRDTAALFVPYMLLDIVGFIGIAFVPYCDARNEVWAFFALLIGIVPICLSPYLLYEYFHHKHDGYSIFTLLNKNAIYGGKFDDAVRNAQLLGSRIAITKDALYSLKSSYYIPFVIPADDMVWIYIERRWYHINGRYNPNLFVVTKGKRVYKLPLGARLFFSNLTKDSETLLLDPLRMVYPHLFFGYTAENKMLFKERFSEMIARVEQRAKINTVVS
jgi:hypothetical protein